MATTVKPSDKVRIGIIGCGGIATSKHLPALHKLSNIEMVAFCDLIRSRAESAAKNYGTPDAKVYENYKELLEDKTIDVVHVLTPNRSHSFISVDAMEAGKHVMCEKPMAINAEEAKKMVDAAKHGQKAHHRLPEPPAQRLAFRQGGGRGRHARRNLLRESDRAAPQSGADLGRVPQRVRAGRRSADRHRHACA